MAASGVYGVLGIFDFECILPWVYFKIIRFGERMSGQNLAAKQQNSKPRSQGQRGKKPRSRWLSLTLFVLLALGIAIRHLQVQIARPQTALVLGGSEKRERFAAELAQRNPDLDVWVSSGSPEGYVKQIFAKAGIASDRLHLDYEAQDTVTNFTTLLDDFQAQGVKSVYLITSENHMRRARVVGEIVFGSQGILIKPLVVESSGEAEMWLKSARDGARALLWLFTGETGVELREKLAIDSN